MLAQSIKGGFFSYPYIKDDPLLNGIRERRGFAESLESARRAHEEFKSRFLGAPTAGQ
ncbi:MAG TPA: hypothetical protein VKD91_09805 [Pyrinomonadaceae bacterium]|nr:hypothetical protein [Pyrinomonadaceae bacterium]